MPDETAGFDPEDEMERALRASDLAELGIAPLPEQPAEPVACEHRWESRHKPDHLLYWVRSCSLCHEVDWDDLDAEIGKLPEVIAAIQRGQAGALSARITKLRIRERARDERIRELEAQLEHASAAAEGSHEGIRLWMLDCAKVADRWQQRAEDAERQEAILLRNWQGDRDKICAVRTWGERELAGDALSGLLAILEAKP